MTEPRTPGRPRSEASRQAILTATFELVSEIGYAGTTIEGIAARAKVGKQTIYRWWASKADVLMEVTALKADMFVPLDDAGSFAAELRAFVEASYRIAAIPMLADLLRVLAAEAQLDADFGERFRVAFVDRRRHALAVITERARLRGDLPTGISEGTVADLVLGSIWYRTLATREPPDTQLATELVAVLSRQ